MRVVDLFCGCGGSSLGFQTAGMKVVAGYDYWIKALNVYKANHNHTVILHDLSSKRAPDFIRSHKPDIIIGSPPCQDFSLAGKQIIGDRANLTIRFAEIVSSVRPKWVVMENVPEIARVGAEVLTKTKAILRLAGYGLTERVLNASLCGVPQARKRYFLVGLLGAEDDFIGTDLDAGLSKKPMTVRDYLGDTLGTDYFYMHQRNGVRRSVYSIDEPSRTVYGNNSPIPASYRKRTGDKADVASGSVRALTTKERSYLQSFPETYSFAGTKTDLDKMIGNAVPPNMAEYVARTIIRYAAKAGC